QCAGAVPVEEGVDALVELVGRRTVHVEVGARAPAQIGVGVVVRKAQRAAARSESRDGKAGDDGERAPHQKLSTEMWPGLRRRCLRSPRAMSAAVVSFSMSGLPHSMIC